MIQIRHNVFETNSSSSHSLIMLKEDKPLEQFVDPEYLLNDKGQLRLWPDMIEFGRSPFQFLTTWYERLCYAIACFAYDDEMRDKLEEICYSRVIGFKGFRFPTRDYYERHPDDFTEKYNYGYVDHQSMDLLENFLNNNGISLEEFIFNDRYIVVIDGDEYNIFDTIRGLPTWNGDAVEKIVGVFDDDTD